MAFIYFICDLYKSLLLITRSEGGEGNRTPESPSTNRPDTASQLINNPKQWSCVIAVATSMKKGVMRGWGGALEKSRLSTYEELPHRLKKKKKAQINNSLMLTHILASTRSTTCIKFSPRSDGSGARTGVPGGQRSHSDVPALFQSGLMRGSRAPESAWELQQRVKRVSICCRGPCCLSFSTFRSAWFFYWDFSLWLPTERQDGAIQFQLTGGCSVLKLCYENFMSLSGSAMRVWCICLSGKTQRRVKRNMSWILASLWINVHSVKKRNWINSISAPRRCRSRLRRSISNPTVFVFQKNKYMPRMYRAETWGLWNSWSSLPQSWSLCFLN